MRPFTSAALLSLSGLFLTTATAAKFDSQIERCPQACSVAGPSSTNWTSYHSLGRLDRCKETIVFNLNVFNSLISQTTIKACTVIDNVDSGDFSKTPSTCASGSSTSVSLQLALWDSTTSDLISLSSMLKALAGLESQVASTPSCDNTSTILFVNHGDIIAGIDNTAAVRELAKKIASTTEDASLSEASAAQACNTDQNGAHTMGLVVTRARSYQLLQSTI